MAYYRRRRRRGPSAARMNRLGLPNKSEQRVVDMNIRQLICNVGNKRRYRVRMYHPVGDKHGSWEYEGSLTWEKLPDFFYEWRGEDAIGSPVFVVEVFGINRTKRRKNKLHYAREIPYLVEQYRKAGVYCLVLDANEIKKDQRRAHRKILKHMEYAKNNPIKPCVVWEDRVRRKKRR